MASPTNAILIDIDLVPRYEDAGITATINSVAAGYNRDQAILDAINAAVAPDLTWEAFLAIFSDLDAAGFLAPGVEIFGIPAQGNEQPGQLFIPTPVTRTERVGGIASDGSFFSTPTTGTYNIRVYKNGALDHVQANQDISTNRTINNTGFVSSDIMQVGLEAGNVVGWWGRQTIA